MKRKNNINSRFLFEKFIENLLIRSTGPNRKYFVHCSAPLVTKLCLLSSLFCYFYVSINSRYFFHTQYLNENMRFSFCSNKHQLRLPETSFNKIMLRVITSFLVLSYEPEYIKFISPLHLLRYCRTDKLHKDQH